MASPMLSVIVPEIHGWLQAIFFGLLMLLTGAVGLFALFVIAQQFRNPGRGTRQLR
jgi:threonine/homoserine/homoserine lactone efflux protein